MPYALCGSSLAACGRNGKWRWCFEVHDQPGSGFNEEIYERAVAVDLKKRNIPCEQQRPVSMPCKDELAGTYRLDLVIDGTIIHVIRQFVSFVIKE